MEAQRLARLPRVKSTGLFTHFSSFLVVARLLCCARLPIGDDCSRSLLGRILGLLIFVLFVRGSFFSAVQLQNRGHPNLPDAPLRVRLLAVVLPAAQFAFHLNVCTLGERLGELRELAEDYATVPFGVRDVLAILLVGGLGRQRKSGEAEVRAVSASFWVAAEKADEGHFVLVHES